jgi:hypothetical protein
MVISEKISINNVFSESLKIMMMSLKRYKGFPIFFIGLLFVASVIKDLFGGFYFSQNHSVFLFIAEALKFLVLILVPIVYISSTFQIHKGEDEANILKIIGNSLMPLIGTNILSFLIVTIPSTMIIYTSLMNTVSGLSYSGNMIVGFIITAIVFCVFLYINVRLFFINQAVIISKKYYLEALKWSYKITRKHIFMCVGIFLLSIILTSLNNFFYSISHNLMFRLISDLFLLLGQMFSMIALTVLYIKIEDTVKDDMEISSLKRNSNGRMRFKWIVIFILSLAFSGAIYYIFDLGMKGRVMSVFTMYLVIAILQAIYGLLLLKLISINEGIKTKPTNLLISAIFLIILHWINLQLAFSIGIMSWVIEISLEVLLFMSFAFFPVCNILGGLDVEKSLGKNFELIKKNFDLIILVASLYFIPNGFSAMANGLFDFYENQSIVFAIVWLLKLLPHLVGAFIFSAVFLKDKELKTAIPEFVEIK